jgi:hypothetical protein
MIKIFGRSSFQLSYTKRFHHCAQIFNHSIDDSLIFAIDPTTENFQSTLK